MPNKKTNSDSDKPAAAKRTLIKPITGKKAAPAEEPKKPAKEEEKPAKKRIEKPKGEVTSLIDEDGKTKPQPKLARRPITANSRAVLPTISRIMSPEVAPVPDPVPVAPPPIPANATAEVSESGEKVLHVSPWMAEGIEHAEEGRECGSHAVTAVHDAHGHVVVDDVLREVAERVVEIELLDRLDEAVDDVGGHGPTVVAVRPGGRGLGCRSGPTPATRS